jgi:hypothetical protein
MVKQRQMLNDLKENNSSDKDSSNFNFSIIFECDSLEEKDINKFLDDVYKKSVGDNIRQCNKRKKFSVRQVSKMSHLILHILFQNHLVKYSKSHCDIIENIM